MMDAVNLHTYIWQGIRKDVQADKIQLYLPFFFGAESDEPLCLTWSRDGVLSDSGRTVSELKKRVGDIQPYLHTIQVILSRCGDCRLVAGQAIVKDHFQTVISGEKQYSDYLGGLNLMLKAISLISTLDSISISDHGEVCL